MRRILTAVALTCLALTAGSCGDADRTERSGEPGTATTSTPSQQPALAYARCLQENGLEVPDPVPGDDRIQMDPGASEAEIEAAQEACKEYAPPRTAERGERTAPTQQPPGSRS